jgi:hypothetical protein
VDDQIGVRVVLSFGKRTQTYVAQVFDRQCEVYSVGSKREDDALPELTMSI